MNKKTEGQSEYGALMSVPPHQRREVKKRIAAIERHIASPGTASALANAKKLGMSLQGFYRLARIWKAHGRPDLLVHYGAGRERKDSFTAAQRKLIDKVLQTSGGRSFKELLAEVTLHADRDGFKMPTAIALRRYIKKAMKGTLPASIYAAGADYCRSALTRNHASY
ncbi:hypothetical protein [Novosphingopyxis sp.]|uniref:hypothetical protein n=1 Tax=Novosphingopyxis sp. TaxID=2709690 RepID=UPI003B5B9B3C